MARKARKNKHNPSHKIDKTVAIALFFLFLAVIYIMASDNKAPTFVDTQELKERQAWLVANKIDRNTINNMENLNYQDLKELTGESTEFVIYFEDNDGNIVDLNDRSCIGSKHASVNGHTCS